MSYAGAQPLSQVLQQYTTALQNLITAHAQLYPKQQIDLNSNRLILQTYQKLITPSVIWINGYAQTVRAELVRNFNFYDDLHHLFAQYLKHTQQVQKIVQLFPEQVQGQAQHLFNQVVANSVVQVCYDIVKMQAYQTNFDGPAMQAGWTAYQLAWRAKTTSMQIFGCANLQDFENSLANYAQVFFNAANQHYQAKLQQGMVSSESTQDIYKNLQFCAQCLEQIYTNSGNSAQAQEQQTVLSSLVTQRVAYQKALQSQKQSDIQLKTLQGAIELSGAHPEQTLHVVQQNLKALGQLVTTYTTIATQFATASDLNGQMQAESRSDMINNYDILLRFMQKMWCLFLIDQSAQGVYTLPTIATFANGQGAGQVQNAVQALQNLSAMISNQYQTVNNLLSVAQITQTQDTQDLLLTAIVQDMQEFAQKNCVNVAVTAFDALVDATMLEQTLTILKMIDAWSNALVQALSNSEQAQAAQAMGMAQNLDTLFSQNVDIKQWVAHLPDCLSSQQTWTYLTAQFLVQAGLVTTSAQAMAMIATAKVAMPQTFSSQDLQVLQTKANALWVQAQQAQVAQNFLQASTLYQKAMNDFTKLYTYVSDGASKITFSQKANMAQSRFVANSFAGLVQELGQTTFAGFNNIPTGFCAKNYALVIDLSMLVGNMPQVLSTLTSGAITTTLDAAQKQQLLQLAKAYLVAVYLQDRGSSFSTYFSDYTMTLAQPSQTASKAIEEFTEFLQSSKNMQISSVESTSQTSVTIHFVNFPLAAVNSLCSVLPCAAEFFSSAALLMQTGSDYLTIGGQSYYPGNDAAAQNIFFVQGAYAYLAQAAQLVQQLNTLMQKPFSSEVLNEILNISLSAQALLYGTLGDNAYSLLVKAGMISQAEMVKNQFLSLYEQQIAFCTKYLAGNPTTHIYQNVVVTINKLYVSWAAEQPSVVGAINQKIAQLYKTAGDAVLKFKYVQKEYPKFEQIHYLTAAQYYQSALLQYTSLHDVAQQAAMQAQVNAMYFQGCAQNLALYFYVKKNGATYISEQNVATAVSFEQLAADFLNFSQNGAVVDANELTLYSTVQNLLVDAAIVFEQLSNAVTSNNKAVLAYLHKSPVQLALDISSFSLIPLAKTQSVIALASTLYTKFHKNPANFAACNQLLFNMVKNQYLMDYLDITATSTGINVASATQEFLAAIQKESLNLSNPSAGYIQ
jgi:hypothetical protein